MSDELPLDVVIKPELVLPTLFDRERAALRNLIEVTARWGGAKVEIQTADDRILAIQAGRMLQQLVKKVEEFYKPIKQEIDKLKKPILDYERVDLARIKTVKDELALAVQEFDRTQRKAEAIVAKELGTDEDGMPIPSITPAAVQGKTRGVVNREKWTAEVTDFQALVNSVYGGWAPLQALEPNQEYLDRRADTDREGFHMAGVVAHKIEKVHFRG